MKHAATHDEFGGKTEPTVFNKLLSILKQGHWYHVSVLGLFFGLLIGHLYHGDMEVLKKTIAATMGASVVILSVLSGVLIYQDRRIAGKGLAISAAVCVAITDIFYLLTIDNFLVLLGFNLSALILLLAIVKTAAGVRHRG